MKNSEALTANMSAKRINGGDSMKNWEELGGRLIEQLDKERTGEDDDDKIFAAWAAADKEIAGTLEQRPTKITRKPAGARRRRHALASGTRVVPATRKQHLMAVFALAGGVLAATGATDGELRFAYVERAFPRCGRRHSDRMKFYRSRRDALKRMGCASEIVSWRTRVFVPDADVLERVVERYPIALADAA